MFLHSFKYTLLTQLKDKNTLFWCMAFPIVLATIFSFAFSNLASSEQFQSIDVAVVEIENEDADLYSNVSVTDMLDELSVGDETPLLKITYATEEEAMDLLEQKKIFGILYADNGSIDKPLTLTISAEMTEDPLFQSILSVFVEQFNVSFRSIKQIAISHPEKVADAVAQLEKETAYLKTGDLGTGDLDEMLNYFFNLLSMTCLYGAITGFVIAIRNQANLSNVAMRKAISPNNPIKCMHGDLLAGVFYEYICVMIALLYCKYILNINFGNQYGYLFLAGLAGVLTGVSFGFFIGCIGKNAKEEKMGVMVGVIMTMCMLSGMMYGSMRIVVENKAPIVNKVNPSALIADSFYALIVYPSHERFWQNIIMLCVESLVFYIGGIVFIRRKKYASV